MNVRGFTSCFGRARRLFALPPFMAALLLVSAAHAVGPTARPWLDPGWHRLDSSLKALVLRLDAPNAIWNPSARSSDGQVPLFIEAANPDDAAREIERLGGSVGTRVGTILTARIPGRSLLALGAMNGMVRMEAGRPIHTRLDKALPAMNVNKIHAGAPFIPSRNTGAGVIVGVMDVGLDLAHAAFTDSAGHSRVLALWDQGEEGGAKPEGFSYGSECSKEVLAAGNCPHQPAADHGTHVTGIAAGGPVDGVPYVGVAPDANIVFVNLGEAPTMGDAKPTTALSTAVCDAAAYIFGIARKLGRPAVINMSIGSHDDPHDGTSLGSRCLDALAGPGRIMVASAGNEGGTSSPWRVHAGLSVSAERVVLPFGVGEDGSKTVSAWFDSGTLTTRLAVAVDENTPPTLSEPITADRPAMGMLMTPEGEVGPFLAAIDKPGEGPGNLLVLIADGNMDGLEARLGWFLVLEGNAPRVDVFIDTTGGGGLAALPASSEVTTDSKMTIGFPAISSKVLAVASYITRNSWEIGGRTIAMEGKVGDRSAFSSTGPARDDKLTGLKPDIAAPGQWIVSALARVSGPDDAGAPENPDTIIRRSPNGYHLLEGTSMASPAVAGVVALLLAAQPALTVEQARSALASTAVVPEGVTNLPNTEWGAGKVNALAALQQVMAMGNPATGDDAGAVKTPDGGATTTSGSGASPSSAQAASAGCSCRAGASPSTAGSVVFLLGAMVALGRHRARRKETRA